MESQHPKRQKIVRGPKKQDLAKSLSTLFQILSANSIGINNKDERDIIIDRTAKSLTEFFSSYLLISYTIDGDPAIITYAPTQKDYFSLNALLQQHIINSSPNKNNFSQ